MIKSLWRGVFNFHNGITREYAYAHTEKQAKFIMAKRIAKKQGVTPIILMAWLKEHKESYKIALEVEWKEI